MKRKITFLIAALCAVMLITQPVKVWATDQTIEITYEQFPNTSYNTSENTFTKDGITFGYINAMRNGSNGTPSGWAKNQVIQTKSGGYIYNKTAISGLKNIRVYIVANTNSFAITSGTTSQPTTNSVTRPNSPTGTQSITYTAYANQQTTPNQTTTASYYDFTISNNNQYFRIAPGGSLYIWKIVLTYEESGGSTPSNLALTGAPIALEFDLYNNSEAQVINYTTSSTGTVSIADNQYFNKVIDSENKTITITPIKVTPSAQTITVNQAADATYAAGSVTFTLSISDSSPTPVWALTDIEDLTTSDIFVIVGRYNSTNYSMTNDGGSTRPTASSITISNNMIDNANVANNIKWNISGNETNGYVFYPNGSTTTWLYNTDDNDGVKVGTETTKAYTYSGGYLSIKPGTDTRYLSYYSGQWRSYKNTNSAFTVTFYKRAYPSSIATPTLSKGTGTYIGTQNVTIGCETDNVTLYYTLDGSDPTDSENEGRLVYSSQLSISSSTTLKAAAYKNSEYSWIAKAKYTIVQPYTSIEDMFNDASATPTDVYVTFNNWVVTGVSDDYAYVTDGTNGFIIKQSSHGFAKGNKISGTTTNTCSLDLHHGYARIQGITNSTTGLSVTTGGSVEILDVAMSELTGVNTGALISYHDLTYSETNGYLEDGNGTQITPYNQLYNYDDAFEDGETYHVTGVFQIYDSKKEILPREASDIVLAADMSLTDFSGLTTFTYVLDLGPSAKQNVDILGTDFAGNMTVSASSDYEVSLDNSTYSASVVLSPSTGAIMETIYVRLKSGLATGTHNGTLTFTATNLTTVVQNLTGIVSENQTYAITLIQPSYATIAADFDVAEAGETVTLSYSDLDDCYNFTSWSVYKTGDQSTTVTVNGNEFTMQNYDVTATAILTQKKFTVNYSVNGVIEPELIHTNITCGDEAELWDEDYLEAAGVEIPSGFDFMGWSASVSGTTILNSFIPTENTTLYALLLPTGATTNYVKITKNLTDWTGEYLIVNETNNVALNGGINSTSYDAKNNKISVTISNLSIESTNAIESARFIVESTNTENVYTLKSAAGFYIGRTTNETGIDASNSTQYTNTFSIVDGNAVITASNNYVLRYNAANDQQRFRYYSGSSVQAIQLYKKEVPTPYTYVEDVTSTTASIDNIEEGSLITVKNGGILTLTGTNNGTAANLIIEDGGQLITSSSVQLTYKKGITSAAKDGGWYTISTPVHTASNTFLEHESVENLILASESNYDLFYYNEATHYWMNYKQAEFDLNIGQGYLYRNNGAELHFAGYNNQATSYNVALSYASSEDKLLGFNLIGNPYPQNITMSDVTVNNDGTLSGGYVLSKDGAWSADVAATIAPAQGFLVQIDKTGVTATITKPTGGSKSRANNDYIKFIVANSQHEDAAFALFEEGYGLNKIDHRNSDIPMLYIPKEGHNFAIATMADNTQSFNLNLKAKTTGKYTLTYKATGNFSYLHVIDRLTGEDVDMLLDGEYSFIASPSDAENRFIVRLEYMNGLDNSEDSIFAYQSGSDIIVNGEGELQIFDVMGRRILTQYVSGVETINLQSHGVYIFKLNEKTQKIVVR